MSTRRIFIGGTGRSGTTVLYDIFRDHPEIFALPQEMRLLTDGAGIIPMIEHLSTGFTQARSRDAIARFERLMMYDLVHPERTPYRHYKFERTFGDGYKALVQAFIAKISLGKFEAETIQTNYEELYYWDGNYSRLRKKKTFAREYQDYKTHVARYFSDRAELVGICARFVDDLFGILMEREGKQIWCEKTPANANNFLALRELFPNAALIHIKRDPRGVCHSYRNQDWAPSDLELTCDLLSQRYERWLDVKQKFDNDSAFVDIKLEDLAIEPEKILSNIAAMVGVGTGFQDIERLDLNKVNYWRTALRKDELEIVNNKLGKYIELMGYDI